MPRLEAALATIETVYYNATAQAAGKDAQAAYQLTPDKAMGIMDAVKKNNDDILEGAAPAGAGLQQK